LDPAFENKELEIVSGTPAGGFAGSVNLSEGKITLQKDLDVCEAIQILIVELSNFSHRRDFKELGAACREGMKSREEYIKETEEIEFIGVRQVITLFDKCSEKWGCNSCRYEGVRGLDFEKYYAKYTYEEANKHKEYYGQWWDRNCKAEWELRHIPVYTGPIIFKPWSKNK
jgi:hypothetical protein